MGVLRDISRCPFIGSGLRSNYAVPPKYSIKSANHRITCERDVSQSNKWEVNQITKALLNG